MLLIVFKLNSVNSKRISLEIFYKKIIDQVNSSKELGKFGTVILLVFFFDMLILHEIF